MGNSAVLAIDIGGSKLLAGLVDRQGYILASAGEPLPGSIDQGQLLSRIVSLVQEVRQSCPDAIPEAAGAAIPGLADSKSGKWVYACFSGVSDFNIAEELSSLLHVPVFIGNDVNVCAYGEKVYGSCGDVDDFLWVTVSNGIGGGLVLNGEIYEGAYGGSGEIGHVVVEEINGWSCPCGNRGCLEAQASGRAIARHYGELTGKEGLSAKEVAERAKAGEGAAVEAYNRAGYYLGKAIASFVNAVNPAKVILGGGVSMDAELFMPALRESVSRYVFRQANGKLIIEKTALGYHAALAGAAAIAWKGLGE